MMSTHDDKSTRNGIILIVTIVAIFFGWALFMLTYSPSCSGSGCESTEVKADSK